MAMAGALGLVESAQANHGFWSRKFRPRRFSYQRLQGASRADAGMTGGIWEGPREVPRKRSNGLGGL